MTALSTPRDALHAASIEIEALRDQVERPNGKRNGHLRPTEKAHIAALNAAWDRIDALRAQLEEAA